MAFFVSFSFVTYGNTIKPMQKMVNSNKRRQCQPPNRWQPPNDKDRVFWRLTKTQNNRMSAIIKYGFCEKVQPEHLSLSKVSSFSCLSLLSFDSCVLLILFAFFTDIILAFCIEANDFERMHKFVTSFCFDFGIHHIFQRMSCTRSLVCRFDKK